MSSEAMYRIPHLIRGEVLYSNEQVGERGREQFTISVQEDGQRTLRALCELDERHLMRDVTYSLSPDFQPLDAFVRLHKNGQFLGSGWFRWTDTEMECEAFNAQDGRTSQKIALERPCPSFGPHPISCDTLHLAAFDHSAGENPQFFSSAMSSLEHDGGSGPALHSISFGIEYLGREQITVPAGTFDADHYRFLLEGALPEEHPLEELWCRPEDYVFLKVVVAGEWNSTYELVSLEEWKSGQKL